MTAVAEGSARPGVRERLRWTVERFEAADEAGLFGYDARVELLDGEVYELVTMNPPHADVQRAVEDLLRASTDPAAFTVGSQSPVILGDRDEPQPDGWVARGPRRPTYSARHPLPPDLLLVVEVSDSTLEDDRRLKVPRYAVAGLPLVWLVDVRGRRVEVLTTPLSQAKRYADTSVREGEDRLVVGEAGVDLRAGDLFPPET